MYEGVLCRRYDDPLPCNAPPYLGGYILSEPKLIPVLGVNRTLVDLLCSRSVWCRVLWIWACAQRRLLAVLAPGMYAMLSGSDPTMRLRWSCVYEIPFDIFSCASEEIVERCVQDVNGDYGLP